MTRDYFKQVANLKTSSHSPHSHSDQFVWSDFDFTDTNNTMFNENSTIDSYNSFWNFVAGFVIEGLTQGIIGVFGILGKIIDSKVF